MITVKSLYKIFGDKPEKALEMVKNGESSGDIKEKTGNVIAVKGVSFTINPGDTFVIMGLSGSGKSTLLRCINRLIEPDEGTISFDLEGEQFEVTSLSKSRLPEMRNRYISMVFQEFGLFPWRRVINNVTYGLEIQGKNKVKREKAALEVLEMVGLKKWATSFPHELSGGMKQRVGLARALATGVPVLLMDEPFSALDPLIRVKMQDELNNLQTELKKTIIFVTHDLDEALKMGDKIAIMEGGEIVQLGTPESIILNPQTEYVANFVKNANVSNVLSARSVAKKFDYQDGSKEITPEGESLIKLSSRNLKIMLNTSGQLEKILRGEEEIPFRELKSSEDLSDQNGEFLFLVREEVPMKLIMEARVSSSLPQLLLNENNEIVGIIEEKDIINSLLHKKKI